MDAVAALHVGETNHGLRPVQGMGTSGDVAGPLRRVEVLKYQDGAMKVVEVPTGAASKRTSSSWCP